MNYQPQLVSRILSINSMIHFDHQQKSDGLKPPPLRRWAPGDTFVYSVGSFVFEERLLILPANEAEKSKKTR